MIRSFVLALILGMLVACAHATTTEMRDGWLQIDCSHLMRDCKREAGADCPEGYEEAGEGTDDERGVAVATTVGNVTLVSARTRVHGTMIIRCKTARRDPEMP